MRLGIALHSPLGKDISEGVIVVLSSEVSDDLTIIPKELVSALSAFYDISCKGGKPCVKIVSGTFLEFVEHLAGPVELSCLPAVSDDIAQTVLAHKAAGSVLVHVKILVEVIGDSVFVELVNLKTSSFRRSGAVLMTGKGISETDHLPVSCGSVPRKDSVCINLGSKVDHISLGRCSCDRGSGHIVKIRRCSETCLCDETVHPGSGVEFEFSHRNSCRSLLSAHSGEHSSSETTSGEVHCGLSGGLLVYYAEILGSDCRESDIDDTVRTTGKVSDLGESLSVVAGFKGRGAACITAAAATTG